MVLSELGHEQGRTVEMGGEEWPTSCVYGQGKRPAIKRMKATLATSVLREVSARTQFANSFIVSLRFGEGSGMHTFVPFGFCPFV